MRNVSFVLAVVLLSVVGCLSVGCAQDTQAKITQDTQQAPDLRTEQAQQGVYSHNVINVQNAPGTRAGSPASPTVQLFPTSQPAGAILADGTFAANEAAWEAASTQGPLQGGIVINITTTGSGSNTATPTQGSQTANPSAPQSLSPNQEPTANVTTPIAVGMPGSAPQASGQGQIGSGTQTLTPQQQNELRTLLAEVKAGIPGALEKLTAFLGQPTPANAPATNPAPVP